MRTHESSTSLSRIRNAALVSSRLRRWRGELGVDSGRVVADDLRDDTVDGDDACVTTVDGVDGVGGTCIREGGGARGIVGVLGGGTAGGGEEYET
jgi:hypothetical protein